MCGIAGVVCLRGDSPSPRDIIEGMLASIRYRGPDSSRIESNAHGTFGCNRLAIVDVLHGHQPVVAADGSLFVFNGEIFNYRELPEYEDSLGDTATLFRRIVNRRDWRDGLEGQFALAYLSNDRLTLARDANGILPLFYAVMGDTIWFGSEERAIFAAGIPRILDGEKAFISEVLWGCPPDDSVWVQIEQVPPGGSVEFDLNTAAVSIHHKWQARNFRSGPPNGERLLDELRRAVRIRVPTEVEYGVLLSGGLDSSAIAALASDSSLKPRCAYAIAFEDSDLDESRAQDRVAEWLDLRLVRIRPSADELASAFVDTVRHVGQPLIRTAPLSTLLLGRRIQEDGIKVVLSGEGADEYFGGYELFKVTYMRSTWDGEVDNRLLDFMDHLEGLPGEQRSIEPAYYQRYLGTQDTDPFFSHRLRWSTTCSTLSSFLNADGFGDLSLDSALEEIRRSLPPGFDTLPLLERTRTLEVETLLHSSLLASQCDRVLMASAVEARYPFLDESVREIGASLGWNDLFDDRWNEKLALRRSLMGILPDDIRNRPKQAYAAPTSSLFRSQIGQTVLSDQLRMLEQRQLDWVAPGAIEWLLNRMTDESMSIYDEIVILWFASISVLIAETPDPGSKSYVRRI